MYKQHEAYLKVVKNEDEILQSRGQIQGLNSIYLPTYSIFKEKLGTDARLKTTCGGAGATITEVCQKHWIPSLLKLDKSFQIRL